jgi:hypothetical protein
LYHQYPEQPSKTLAQDNQPIIGPKYYRRGQIEVWDFIRDQGLNYHLGNAIKYVCRAGHKESKISDLTKAIHYLQNELQNEILSERTSKGVSEKFPGQQQYEQSFTDWSDEFDR